MEQKSTAFQLNTPLSYGVSRFLTAAMVLLIFSSSLCLVLTTEPSLPKRLLYNLKNFEIFACFIFFAEYLIRLWLAENRTKYVFSFMGLIDLMSFLPMFLLMMGIEESPQLMLIQLSRLVKLTRYSLAFHLLADVLRDEAESLLVSVMLMFIILIFASVGIYIFEHDVQPDAFGSVPKSMWWAIVTLTTVGYGDVTPITVQGKIFATFITIAGVGLVSLPAGIIASGFTEQLRLRREKFQMEVEQMIQEDGKLSQEELGQLEIDRQKLGLTRNNAQLIISKVEQMERQKHEQSHKNGQSTGGTR